MKGPVNRLYEKFWEVLQRDNQFSSIFKPGNILKYTSHEAAEKKLKHHADYPAIGIFPAGNSGFPTKTTSSAYIWDHSLSIDIKTGDRDIGNLADMEWMIARIILSNLQEITGDYFEGEEYIICVNRKAKNSLASSRNSYGWSSLIQFDVKLGVSVDKFRG